MPVQTETTSDIVLNDFDIYYDPDDDVWRTRWFQESKLLDTDRRLAIFPYMNDAVTNPQATFYVEYDADGDGRVDETSENIDVGPQERVVQINNLPVDENGYYRIVITKYLNTNIRNSLSNLNAGFI